MEDNTDTIIQKVLPQHMLMNELLAEDLIIIMVLKHENHSIHRLHYDLNTEKMDTMVMTLGWMSNLFHNKAKAKPMGRVKWTSSHSSVSSDLKDNLNNSLNVAIYL